MNRFKFLFAGLLGLGAKAMAQSIKDAQPTSGKLTYTTGQTLWCAALDGRERPCVIPEGEESCPLGHAQKPTRILVSVESVIEMPMKPTGTFSTADAALALEEHICSICGLIYVPPTKKP